MTPEERQLLGALAQRVKNVPPQQKDPEAEQYIRQLATERPDTPYVLAQTVIMQDFALRNAQSQIEQLQQQMSQMVPPAPQERPGGFLGGLFGGGRPQGPASGSVPRVNPWGQPDAPPPGYGSGPGYNAGPGYGYGPGPQAQAPQGPVMQPSQTGSFLRGAASTALGVAGGAMLFQGINSMFSGNHGLSTSALAGSVPQDSLTETTINNYYDERGGGADAQQADFGGNSDFGGDEDFGGDDDFGGGDDYA